MNKFCLTPIEVDFIINWFLYYMPMDQREKLMFDHPTLYNKLCRDEIMKVEKKSEYEKIMKARAKK